jgi:hypothetical protein
VWRHALKGYLQFTGAEPPKIHNLRSLCELCCENDNSFQTIISTAASFTKYSNVTRYPNELETDEASAKVAIEKAKSIYEFCLSKVPDECRPKETIGKQGIVAKNNLITLTADNAHYSFVNVELAFEKDNYSNVFANLNGKTVRETLNSDRYKKFSVAVSNKYAKYLDYKLGAFLMKLKDAQDLFYKQFLNPHGDETYTTFKITDGKIKHRKGLYVYCLNGELKYIGRSNDPFEKRINQGYGKIAPKNCYIDGQSTNCHINSLVTRNKNSVKLYVLCLETSEEINSLEEKLIKKYSPEWNIQLK